MENAITNALLCDHLVMEGKLNITAVREFTLALFFICRLSIACMQITSVSRHLCLSFIFTLSLTIFPQKLLSPFWRLSADYQTRIIVDLNKKWSKVGEVLGGVCWFAWGDKGRGGGDHDAGVLEGGGGRNIQAWGVNVTRFYWSAANWWL